MISQADIIRTLINKNCTDESILSIALAPNCTPARLLEKFAESERFELALDVSMKLGLDTAPLWRSWAMRFLRGRDFVAARNKFRVTFQRLRPISGRLSSGFDSNKLLTEILDELSNMDENEITLFEEIRQIRTQSYAPVCDSRTILDRPTILEEATYYLNEYGTIKDRIKFFTQHFLWDSVAEMLLNHQNSLGQDIAFVKEVFLKSASTGFLNNFLTALLKLDPNVDSSRPYFKIFYELCTSHGHFNLLYFIQKRIGDHVAAAENRINHHFLKRPALNYKELNHRLSSLADAINDYREYLKRLGDKKHSISMKNDLRRLNVVKNDLFCEMSAINVEKRISAIELQIDITKNFAINEVVGCISEIEPKQPNRSIREEDSFPVTLFDRRERRKTYLAALVLIYFDKECSSYFSSSGADLMRRISHKFQLNKLDVFKMAARVILEDESCDILGSTKLLLERLGQEYLNEAPLNKKLSPLRKLSPALAPTPAVKQISIQASPKRLLPQEIEKISIPSDHPTTISPTTTTPSSSDKSSTSSSVAQLSNTFSKMRVIHVIDKKQPQVTFNPVPAMPIRAMPNREHLPSPSTNPALGLSAISFTDDNRMNKTSPSLSSSFALPRAGGTGPATASTYSTSGTSLRLFESAQALCDEVIRDTIRNCKEPDYKMKLAKLLSPQSRVELYIELGNLSDAHQLAFEMNRPDYVVRIVEEAGKTNQNHVKTLCQHWLAKHETSSLLITARR